MHTFSNIFICYLKVKFKNANNQKIFACFLFKDIRIKVIKANKLLWKTPNDMG